MNKGSLIVFSGPSGVGKGTIMKQFLERNPNAVLSVSATTRSPREGEVDGVHYHFVSKEQFKKMIEENALLEYAQYSGNYYGTPAQTVKELLCAGRDVVLEIEVQGAMQIKERFPDSFFVFILPPSFEELCRRLKDRHTESEEVIEKRIQTAMLELSKAEEYDYLIVNDEVEKAVTKLEAVVTASKCSKCYMKEWIGEMYHDAQTSYAANY